MQEESNKVIEINGKRYAKDEFTNVTNNIIDKINKKLYLKPFHPLSILKSKIESYFIENAENIKIFDKLSEIVTVKQNFDDLLVPKNHTCRANSDNYYLNKNLLLRAHTTSHYSDIFKQNVMNFLIFGDVYRRDQIDRYHYPVFHQMDAVKLWNRLETKSKNYEKMIINDLKRTCEDLILKLFNNNYRMRWVDAYFPFTHPSFELEIDFSSDPNQPQWTEILGCGMIRQEIIDSNGNPNCSGWACGFGLDRIAMKKFDIPDIRLFWSDDSRFIDQFKESGFNTEFQPYSKYPSTNRDISFWQLDTFDENTLNDVIRSYAGDLVENVNLHDTYIHPKTGRTSLCYRIIYRSMDRNLTDTEVNIKQDKICAVLQQQYHYQIRGNE